MPEEIWDDMVKNERNIFFSLMFLNGSVLWAYYSCLSAQDFYTVEFADSGLDFSFLTTLCTSWPMVIGQAVQMIWSLDKKLTQEFRVRVGYGIFILMAILIMIFSAINFSNQKTGAILVLICFGCVGFGNTLSESTYYTIAALFPAVQIGNGTAGILNISLATLLRLAVGGVHQTSSSTKLAFYLFFGILIVVLIVALQGGEPHEPGRQQDPEQPVAHLRHHLDACRRPVPRVLRVSRYSLASAALASRNLAPPYSDVTHTVTRNWYCAPGIVGSYNYGDFFGPAQQRVVLRSVYRTSGFIPLLLMGVAGTSLYAFGHDDMTAIVYNIILNLLIGLSNGFLSTVTMGVGPRLLNPEDRESGGAVMVLCLFLGIAGGSTLGFFFSDQGWLGL
ncbi:Major facilitator superfamily domain [Phytophthora cactorum]|nr:Major facilitator superfamily domain [Phytophthora cactorum]